VHNLTVREKERKERPFFRFLTCVVRGHMWDPYPAHLRGAELMECARCGLRARPVHGLQA
jgi:hypothetical protein